MRVHASQTEGIANADRSQRDLLVHSEMENSFGGWTWGEWRVPEGVEIRKLAKARSQNALCVLRASVFYFKVMEESMKYFARG